MRKFDTLKKREDFIKLSRSVLCIKAHGVILQYGRWKGEGKLNIGITASKKTGNAVTRNLIRRRVKCILDSLLQSDRILNDFVYVIICTKRTPHLPFQTLYKNLSYCFESVREQHNKCDDYWSYA